MTEYLFMGEQSHLKQNSSSFLQANMTSLDYTSTKLPLWSMCAQFFQHFLVLVQSLVWGCSWWHTKCSALLWICSPLFCHESVSCLSFWLYGPLHFARTVLHQNINFHLGHSCSDFNTLAHLLQKTKRVLLTLSDGDTSQESLVLEWVDLHVISPVECAQPWTERLQRMWEEETAAIFVLWLRNV